MAIGSVKFFSASKGFGFIIPEIEGKDVFVHKEALHLAGMLGLDKGQRISYEIEQDAKGAVKAAKLEPLTPNSSAANSINQLSHLPREKARQDTAPRKSGLSDLAGDDRSKQKNGRAIGATQEWQQKHERYCELARNADHDQVAREGYWQHAEHFYRMMNGSAN